MNDEAVRKHRIIEKKRFIEGILLASKVEDIKYELEFLV
jgi:hypothetical protein